MARGDAAIRVSPVERFGRGRFLRALRLRWDKPVLQADTLASLASTLPT